MHLLLLPYQLHPFPNKFNVGDKYMPVTKVTFLWHPSIFEASGMRRSKVSIAWMRTCLEERVIALERLGIRVAIVESPPPHADLTYWTPDKLPIKAKKVLTSPMFLTTPDERRAFTKQASFNKFYEFFKQKHNILSDVSIVDDNSKITATMVNAYDNMLDLEGVPTPTKIAAFVNKKYHKHIGNASYTYFPTTREAALVWLDAFIERRLYKFASHYNLMLASPGVYHSGLSMLLNIGLLRPAEVLAKVIGWYNKQTPATQNSIARDVDEFVRGLYWREYALFASEKYYCGRLSARLGNHFGHKNRLNDRWYNANLGIGVIDATIMGALKYGWVHHTARLMLIGNIMQLFEIAPLEVYKWFAEVVCVDNPFVLDQSWVLRANIFGALGHDGGQIVRKMPICAGSFVARMSANGLTDDEKAIIDALFYRFLHQHKDKIFGTTRQLLNLWANKPLSDRQKMVKKANSAIRKYVL